MADRQRLGLTKQPESRLVRLAIPGRLSGRASPVALNGLDLEHLCLILCISTRIHTNLEGFFYEGEEIREFLGSQDNMIVICGDRHYQYVIEHAETGLREYATGPVSDPHARGWSADDIRPEHRYLNIIGGFLSVTAERRNDVPTLLLRHHDVDGELLNEELFVAE